MILIDRIYDALDESLRLDPSIPVDEWSDAYMIIPKSSGSNEYGPYRTARTPHAREIMRCLSDDHPAKRVVCMVSSQMFKTQVALNWFGSTVHQSPGNFLWLMPTGALAKRLSARVDKTIKAVDVLRERVAKPNSRDAKNTQEVKEYIGGTLFMPTAGSAANLAEVPARRVAIDEVDRCESNVDNEGDPIKLAEARQTTFSHNKKSYYYSSPTIDGESRIAELFEIGTKRRALAECIHCGHAQELIFENLITTNDSVAYPCVECGGLHVESDKPKMFKNGLWTVGSHGDGETESFTSNSMYLPYGWLSWADLVKEHREAQEKLDQGNDAGMVVFYNTRLARVWKRTIQNVTHQALLDRAEQYPLRIAPEGVLFITAGVDTQDNRLALQIVGWGRNLRAWVIDYVELPGDPANEHVWDDLTRIINLGIQHHTGKILPIMATAIDTGGHRGQAVKHYVRTNRIRCPIAIFGSTNIKAQVISKGSMQDIKRNGKTDKRGVLVHSVGTIEIKHELFSRMENDAERDVEKRMLRFSNELPPEYYGGLLSESYDRKSKRWIPKHEGIRNEPLDTLVYAYAAIHHQSIRAYNYKDRDYERMEENLALKEPKQAFNDGRISLSNWGRG